MRQFHDVRSSKRQYLWALLASAPVRADLLNGAPKTGRQSVLYAFDGSRTGRTVWHVGRLPEDRKRGRSAPACPQASLSLTAPSSA